MDSYQDEEELLIPPDNFCMVEPAIYRCGFPGKKNFPFLKTLNLRTILYLCPEEYPDTHLAFLNQQHVQLLHYGVAGNKEPFLEIPHEIVSEALVQILDTRNHPILVHCNKGKHRTGCIVGVLHKVLGWSLSSIFEEYRMFSRPKERFVDQQFIECWQMSLPSTHSSRCLQAAIDAHNSAAHAAAAGDAANTDGQTGTASGNAAGAGGPTSSLVPVVPDDKAAYLVNPEANEHLLRRGREKELKAAAALAAAQAAAAAREPPATTSHASLQHHHHHHHHPAALTSTVTSGAALVPLPNSSAVSAAAGASSISLTSTTSSAVSTGRLTYHHQHAQSQPNLSTFAPP